MSGSVVCFVVPTKNSARTIEACLRSIRDQEGGDVELVVVDNHSTDGTEKAARRLADLVISAGPERSAQRNLGAGAGGGDHVVFIDSDMVLEPQIARQVRQAFAADPRAGALVLPELAFGDGFWARCREAEKRLYLGDSRVEAARAFRRRAFEEAGGYDTGLTGVEDWDLPDRIRRSGWVIGRVEARVHHDEGHLDLRETFRKKRYYGRTVAPYLARHGPVAVGRAARLALFRKPSRFVREPAPSFGLVGLKAVEALGILAGMGDARRAASRGATGRGA
ncbi:MAG TPA: glycosyltransferase family A protein [Acidimicrobiales bacterium]|nr:glycosyltransferase family A protein [Acidimicrobiales bacterium]